MNKTTGMKTTKSDVHPREHVLSKLLELCYVNTVNELAPRDHALVLDVCALVDEVARAAAAATATATAAAKIGVPSPATATASTVSASTGASSSNGATAPTPSVCSTASSPAPRAVFQSRLKQPTVFWRPSPRAPTSANCGSQLAPTVRGRLETGAARAAVRPMAAAKPAAAITKKNVQRQPVVATRIPAAKTKVPVKATRKTPSVKPVPVRASALTKRTSAKPSAPMSPPPMESSRVTTGASKLRRPAIIVPQGTRAKSTKNGKNGTSGARVIARKMIPIDDNVTKCIHAQAKAELAVATAVKRLGEALKWSVRVEDSKMFINITKNGNGQAHVCVTGDELKAALKHMQSTVFDAVSVAQEALWDVSGVWIDSRWLRARQENVEEDAAQVYDWILDMTMAISDCLGVEFSDRVSGIPGVDATVWGLRSDEKDPVEVDVYAMRAKRVVSSPSKCSVVQAEHAFVSFIAQVTGQLVTITQPEDDVEAQYDLMKRVAADSRDLSDLVARCQKAVEWCGDEITSDVKEWDSILEKNYTLAIRAIEQKMVDCSRLICKVDDRRELATDDQLMLVSEAEQFPVNDYFTLDFYIEAVLDITSIHVRMTEGSDKPTNTSYSKHAYALMAEVDLIVDDIAVWADPRFGVETDSRPYEKDAYLDLIFWCQQLHEEILEQCFFLSESISMRSYNGDDGESDGDDEDEEWLEEYKHDSGQDDDEAYLEAYESDQDGVPIFVDEVEE